DCDQRIRHQAMHHNVTPEKMRQEIEQHDGMNGLVEQVLLAKTIDFLGSNATIDSTTATPVPEVSAESKCRQIATPIILNPCSFRWSLSKPAEASAAMISIRAY